MKEIYKYFLKIEQDDETPCDPIDLFENEKENLPSSFSDLSPEENEQIIIEVQEEVDKYVEPMFHDYSNANIFEEWVTETLQLSYLFNSEFELKLVPLNEKYRYHDPDEYLLVQIAIELSDAFMNKSAFRIIECQECKKLFIAKILRKDIVYCSEKCRKRADNRRNKKPYNQIRNERRNDKSYIPDKIKCQRCNRFVKIKDQNGKLIDPIKCPYCGKEEPNIYSE